MWVSVCHGLLSSITSLNVNSTDIWSPSLLCLCRRMWWGSWGKVRMSPSLFSALLMSFRSFTTNSLSSSPSGSFRGKASKPCWPLNLFVSKSLIWIHSLKMTSGLRIEAHAHILEWQPDTTTPFNFLPSGDAMQLLPQHSNIEKNCIRFSQIVSIPILAFALVSPTRWCSVALTSKRWHQRGSWSSTTMSTTWWGAPQRSRRYTHYYSLWTHYNI